MKKTVLIFFFISVTLLSQSLTLLKPDNRRAFADYLFCESDYLRAALEYDSLYQITKSENDFYSAAVSYELNESFDDAINRFEQMNNQKSIEHIFKIYLQKKEFNKFDSLLTGKSSINSDVILKLKTFKSLYLQNTGISFDEYSRVFENEKAALELFDKKQNPDLKSPMFAALLSTFIPGAGKIYTGNIGDGVMAFVATTLFTFLAIDNFNAGHKFRGWLFSGLSVMFYAGNIYGSYTAGQIYNAGKEALYEKELDNYIKSKDYFLPSSVRCK